MKVEVIKKVTLTLEAGAIIEIDDHQLSLINKYVKVLEEPKETKKKKKGE